MDIKIQVNFAGGLLKIIGPVTGRETLFDPTKTTFVMLDYRDYHGEGQTSGLKNKKTRVGCGCGKDGKTLVGDIVEEDLYKEIT